MFDRRYLLSKSFKVEPFKDTVFVVDNLRDFKMLRAYIEHLRYEKVAELFDGVDTNHTLITLSERGSANTHVVYLPILERQQTGQGWMYMQSVFARYATEIAVRTVQSAGYTPMTESTMFIYLVSRLMGRITQHAERKLGGTITIASDATRYLDVNLSKQQQHYLDLVGPRTLTDLARHQSMVETNGVVKVENGIWSATTYFH